MPSFRPPTSLLLPLLILLVFWARPTHAFGAGNIASTARIEGQNWRHGDIEDTLLTLLMTRAAGGKKFSKMDVKRVYFGNWLRDYSQAVDVGTVKMVSAEAIRILLWILGFLSFGYGTKEFEVTSDRLGCYRPEEHIDNPKDYADNADARDYDRRLRGPVDERRELSVDERTGLKNYIASEDLGITTSAGHVRRLFHNCIELARRYNRNGNKDDLYEALRLLGTGLHCLEDYSAHSNYTELALIELGERDVFPHVGRNTRMRVQGARGEVYPLVTGTFGGVDFLHSVLGEVSDKVTQSEIQELEGTINNAQQQKENASLLQDLLNKLPDGLFGGKDEAGKANELQQNATAAQMENAHISPREPEEWARQLDQIQNQIRPILEFHDEIMQQISEAIDNIPVLPELIEQVQDQVSVFVFSLLAPFVLPIMSQVKAELQTGSSEVIQSSREKQHIVFNDDDCTDPTHSMLSKDHFSNILNEPAGKIASQVLKWAVPQLVECWDDESIDAERTINRIINGVFHHPALRDYGDDGARDGRQLMFRVVESWWGEKSSREQDDLRDKLSRRGVENGKNHKEGVHDSGHGCGKPLSMPKYSKSGGSGGIGGEIIGNILSGGQSSGGGGGGGGGNYGRQSKHDDAFDGLGKAAGDAVGGGALGGLVGGLVGGVGASLLGGAFGDNEKKEYKSEGYNDDGSYTRTYGESGHTRQGSSEKYGKAEYSQTYSSGGRREEYSSYEQTTSYGGSEYSHSERREKSHRKNESEEEEDDGDEDDYEKRQKKERKKREKEEKKRREKEEKYGRHGGEDSEEEKYKRRSGEHKRRSGEHERRSGEYRGGYGEEKRYGEGRSEGYGGGYGGGRQEESGYGRSEGYGGRSEGYGGGRQEYGGGSEGYGGRSEGYGGGGYGGGRQEQSSYGRSEGRSEGYGGGGYGGGRQEESGYGRSEGYGGRSEGYGGQGEGYGGRQEQSSYGRSEGYGSGGYGGGPPGGFPGGDEYGERRRDDEYGERRGYGGGGYGGGY